MSLTGLLNSQPDSNITHENLPIPWFNEPNVAGQMIEQLLKREAAIIGDVGYYWLNQVNHLLEHVPQAKFICLKRARQEVIESTWAHSRGLNVHPTDPWYRMYPLYNTDRKTAIGLMWDDYCTISEKLQEKYPEHFKILDTDSLNTQVGVETILDFAEVPKEEQVIQIGVRLNKRRQ
ncbi:hypothetical protein LCGC14_1863500 [marine sediment metagenome]|uniref:Sulfotransferase domain-containing protein n=1 Tax=marine sediment metagenome TaxID=412755 RepID=A0A0F9IL94_9ZZZZ